MATTFSIPITKAGKSAYIDVNSAEPEQGGHITNEVMAEIMFQGLKVILNRGMTKVTSSHIPDDEERKAEAMKIAQQNFEAMQRNEIKFTGKKPKKELTGEVMVEATRIARAFVRQKMKDEGIKVTHVPARVITKVAKDLVADNPEIVEQAKAAIAARKEKAKQISVNVDLSSMIDPKLVEKEAKAVEERKAALSATKAGKVPLAGLRTRPTAPQPTAH